MVGLWAGSVYVPSAVTQLAARASRPGASAANLASAAAMLLSAGTILGCLVVPGLVKRLGRRTALACFYTVMAVFIPLMFWMDRAWAPPMWMLFAIWLPLITAVTIAALPYMKGAVVGFAWATGVTRQGAG